MTLGVGLVTVTLAVALFGSFSVPVRAAKTADGMFFQLCMCLAIWCVAFVVYLVQCSAGSNSGFPQSNERSCPQFEPLAAIGGAIWCLSNLLLVPLIDTIGIGLTMFMWGVAESLAGWAPARFGLFGLNKEPVASPGLNYAGAALTLGSLILLVFAQPNPSATITTAPAASKGHGAGAPEAADPEGSSVDALQLQSPGRPLPVGAIESGSSSTLVADSEFEGSSSSSSEPELRRRLLALEAGQAAIGAAVVPGDDRCHPMTAVSASGTINARALPSSSSAAVSAAEPAAEGEGKWTDRLSPVQRRVFGAVACVIAGSLSGSTFTPVQHIVDATTNYAASGGPAQDAPFPGASTDLLDHLFAHHCGILAASIAYFLVYLAVCGARGRAPAVHGEEISKYMASGVIWGIAMLCWFLANANLSIVVAFPLVTLGPGLVSVAWGVVVWRELSGWRNIALVAAATAVYLAGAICIVASKQS